MSITKKIANIDICSFLKEVELKKEQFNSMTFRQDHIESPHTDTKSIYFRMCDEISVDSIFNEIEAIDYPSSSWSGYKDIMYQIEDTFNPEKIGRVMLVELKSGGLIKPHMDTGNYPSYYRRFHLPIKSEKGNYFYTDKTYQMNVGELWEVDNKNMHYAINSSDSPRWNLIMDMK